MITMLKMILSKQVRKLSDAEVQEKASTKTEPIIQEVTPTKVIQDQGSSEKGNSERKYENPPLGRTVTYRRRSEEERTRKDKGKAIMTEPEPKKKSKKELEQERLSFAEAIRPAINKLMKNKGTFARMKKLLDSGMKRKGKELTRIQNITKR
ncbi:hypothetical protein Tco_1549077 [Tanacetum coccineum]